MPSTCAYRRPCAVCVIPDMPLYNKSTLASITTNTIGQQPQRALVLLSRIAYLSAVWSAVLCLTYQLPEMVAATHTLRRVLSVSADNEHHKNQ